MGSEMCIRDRAYLTPDGKYLEMDQFANTATGSDVEIDTGEERYVSGYKLTDAVGNMTEYDAAGNIISTDGGLPETQGTILSDASYKMEFDGPQEYKDRYNPFGAGI